jgi:hypothetical protein
MKMGGWSSDSGSSRSYDWSDDSKVTRKSATSYAKDDKRTYSGEHSKGIPAPVGKDIEAKGDRALVLVVDVTGSMGTWPRTIFQKIPTLYAEANAAIQSKDLKEMKKSGKTLEDKLEMSVIAIGDTYSDSQPLQVVDFSKGGELVKGINKIYPEGGGGAFGRESYGLAAYYLDKHCKTSNMPKDTKPILVFACDEDFYDTITASEAKKYTGDTTESKDTDALVKRLSKKFDMYVLRPEPEGETEVYKRAHEHWKKLIQDERVMKMSDPKRLVDCIIGICGYSSDHFDEAKEMLERRQTPEQVKEVMETLHPLLAKKEKEKHD